MATLTGKDPGQTKQVYGSKTIKLFQEMNPSAETSLAKKDTQLEECNTMANALLPEEQVKRALQKARELSRDPGMLNKPLSP